MKERTNYFYFSCERRITRATFTGFGIWIRLNAATANQPSQAFGIFCSIDKIWVRTDSITKCLDTEWYATAIIIISFFFYRKCSTLLPVSSEMKRWDIFLWKATLTESSVYWHSLRIKCLDYADEWHRRRWQRRQQQLWWWWWRRRLAQSWKTIEHFLTNFQLKCLQSNCILIQVFCSGGDMLFSIWLSPFDFLVIKPRGLKLIFCERLKFHQYIELALTPCPPQ